MPSAWSIRQELFGAGVITQEQRAEERVRTLLLGTVSMGDRTVACVICDFSPTGARLRIPGEVVLPDAFELYVSQHWASYLVALRWRNREDVGVEFAEQNGLRPAFLS